ncbi:glycosyltransferase family 61 protein [Marivirga salinae]|uniref:Glycosyltransferase family 61 protein n=1 Tax=Marivirga salinarum TaxID=3059078 RepID=A0AA51NBE0_9BACT|nr:glycosyltransferase family 61 protein [Marivirga sp. BDSF4-3]WMN12184.1 glycosyltransferase family 61 protein [Marivirga sp. BDSF4-3]
MNKIKKAFSDVLCRITTLNFFIYKKPLFLRTLLSFKETVSFSPKYDKLISPNLNKYFFKFLLNYTEIEHGVIFLKKVRYIPETGIVLKNNKVVLSTILDSLGYLRKSSVFKHLAPFLFGIKYKETPGVFFHLSGNMTYNFFHFLIDSLPRVIDFFELKKTYPDIKLLVNNKKPFTVPYLLLCGVKEVDIFFAKQNLLVSKLFIVNNKFGRSKINNLWAYHVYSKLYLGKMKELLFENLEINSQNFPRRRVYISQFDAGTRIVKNEQEVISMLKNHGFETIVLGKFTVANQIKIIATSEFIVGAHGAGFTNLIYADNCKIIELFPFNRMVQTLYQTHQLGQLNENFHILIEVDEADEAQNIKVNVKELEKVILFHLKEQL